MMKSLLFYVSFLFLMPLANAAEPEIWMKDSWDYAIDGYDTVAYFTESDAVKGDDRFVTEYKGVNWRFSSAENLALFIADPVKYSPQYGGHCAYGLGKNGVVVHGDPKRWTIHEGKLYLNLNFFIQKRWQGDKEFYITHADAIWPRALSEEIEVDW